MNIAVTPIRITRHYPGASILTVTGPASLSIAGGTTVSGLGPERTFEHDTPVELVDPVPGQDYGVQIGDDGRPVAIPVSLNMMGEAFAGFHFAPGGNAPAGTRKGGDETPAINPFSCWDAGFRPVCPDPRAMTLITLPDGKLVWVDIYKLGTEHQVDGTSRFGATIADGWKNLPQKPTGKGKVKALDYATAVEIMAQHGKQPLSYDEFRVAAFGVTERTSIGDKPAKAGLDAPRTSACGMMQATGNLYDWGHDGDPDDPRPSIFGGDWHSGGDAGSRCASLGGWAGSSSGVLGARGRSDHLTA
jgi:hypothetical protein